MRLLPASVSDGRAAEWLPLALPLPCRGDLGRRWYSHVDVHISMTRAIWGAAPEENNKSNIRTWLDSFIATSMSLVYSITLLVFNGRGCGIPNQCKPFWFPIWSALQFKISANIYFFNVLDFGEILNLCRQVLGGGGVWGGEGGEVGPSLDRSFDPYDVAFKLLLHKKPVHLVRNPYWGNRRGDSTKEVPKMIKQNRCYRGSVRRYGYFVDGRCVLVVWCAVLRSVVRMKGLEPGSMPYYGRQRSDGVAPDHFVTTR